MSWLKCNNLRRLFVTYRFSYSICYVVSTGSTVFLAGLCAELLFLFGPEYLQQCLTFRANHHLNVWSRLFPLWINYNILILLLDIYLLASFRLPPALHPILFCKLPRCEPTWRMQAAAT